MKALLLFSILFAFSFAQAETCQVSDETVVTIEAWAKNPPGLPYTVFMDSLLSPLIHKDACIKSTLDRSELNSLVQWVGLEIQSGEDIRSFIQNYIDKAAAAKAANQN